MTKYKNWKNSCVLFFIFVVFSIGCQNGDENNGGGFPSISMEKYTDTIYQVLKAHRTSYAKLIINRLVSKEKVIKASESWKKDKALLLPAQLFRETAHILRHSEADLSFSLLSIWPINKKNKPKTDVEIKGLWHVKDNPSLKYYGKEKIGSRTFFTAVYPDNAVSMTCINCHNTHKDSPKKDFRMGDNMGAIVIRVPLAIN